MTDDFIYLDVSALLGRYKNPTENWRDKVYRLVDTQVRFFIENGLLLNGVNVDHIDSLVIRFKDFNEEGRDFIMSQAVERWLSACDRKGELNAYSDGSGLVSRLKKFRAARRGS